MDQQANRIAVATTVTINEPSIQHRAVLHRFYATPTPRTSRGFTREAGGIEDTSTIATRTSFDQRSTLAPMAECRTNRSLCERVPFRDVRDAEASWGGIETDTFTGP